MHSARRIIILLTLFWSSLSFASSYPFWIGKNVEENLQGRQKLSRSVADYLKARQAFSCEADQKCLEFFAAYLEHKEPLIAEDAFAQLVQLPFPVLRDNSERLSSFKLRAYAQDKKLDPVRRDFYAFVLGLKKNPADRRLLAEITDEFFTKESLQNVSMVGILLGYALSGSRYAQPMFIKMLRYRTVNSQPTPRHALDVMDALEFLKAELPDIVDNWGSVILRAALERNLQLKEQALELATKWGDASLSNLLLDYLKKESDENFLGKAKTYCEAIQDEYCRNVLAWVMERSSPQPSPTAENVEKQ